ncbi:MAG: hypothetical protein ABJN69_12535 [Hellea sp.]
MLRSVFPLAALFLLTACATPPPIKPEQFNAVKSGQKAAIFMTYYGDRACSNATLSLMSTKSGSVYSLGPGAGRADGVAVEPGAYQFLMGSCYQQLGSGTRASFKDLAYWFHPIEVEGGEVVDLGTLRFEVLTKKSEATTIDKIENLMTTMSLKDRSNFFLYSFDATPRKRTQKLVAKYYPDLSDKMVIKPPKARLDKAKYEQMIDKAYAKNKDGSSPTSEEAKQRLLEQMKKR